MSSISPDGYRTRADFLCKVKHATVVDQREFHPTADGSALAAHVLIGLGLLPGPPTCEACGATYQMKQVQETKWKRLEDGVDVRRHTYHYQYQAPRPKAGRKRPEARCECYGKCPSITAGFHLRRTQPHLWLDWLDFAVMWSLEYPPTIISNELGLPGRLIKSWARQMQELRRDALHGPLRELVRVGGEGVEVQIDETMLNRRKRSAMHAAVRPQADQVWVWGAVETGQPAAFAFRVLDHPEDALGGRPRGQEEIRACAHYVGLQPGTHLVSDSWPGTLAIDWVAEFGCASHHAINHAAGEVVDEEGRTTNGIENRWSVMKRWLRKRCGGMLPRGRENIKLYLREFQWRKVVRGMGEEQCFT